MCLFCWKILYLLDSLSAGPEMDYMTKKNNDLVLVSLYAYALLLDK